MKATGDNGTMESSLTKILQAGGTSPRSETLESSPCKDAAEPTGDAGYIGWWDESGERAEVLELRRKSGVIAALPYSWIDFAEFDPGTGITIHVRGSKVVIRGRNLNAGMNIRGALFEGIRHRRVSWIRESDRSEELAARESATVVESITW